MYLSSVLMCHECEQALRVLDTNFDGVITPDEFANLTKPEVIDQALAAVAAEASMAESLPYAAELAKAGVDAAAAAAWRALWKEIAGVERDFSAWDAAQWAAAGAEGGFDGAKVLPSPRGAGCSCGETVF